MRLNSASMIDSRRMNSTNASDVDEISPAMAPEPAGVTHDGRAAGCRNLVARYARLERAGQTMNPVTELVRRSIVALKARRTKSVGLAS